MYPEDLVSMLIHTITKRMTYDTAGPLFPAVISGFVMGDFAQVPIDEESTAIGGFAFGIGILCD